MFGRKKKLSRSELLKLKAAHAAGKVGGRVQERSARATAAVRPRAEKVYAAARPKVEQAYGAARPRVEHAYEAAKPRVKAVGTTAAVTLGPRLKLARERGDAAVHALKGDVPRARRRWPWVLAGLGVGGAASMASRMLMRRTSTTGDAPVIERVDVTTVETTAVVEPIETVDPVEPLGEPTDRRTDSP